MSFSLPILDSIVPTHVTSGYIKNYDEHTQKSIEALYQQIKAEALSNITDAPKPGASIFVLVAGSQGVGKTQMVDRLLEGRGEQYIVCDVDSILLRMPEIKEAIQEIENDIRHLFETSGEYNASGHRTAIEQAVECMRPAAKYISDRLMSECVAEGYNVIVETNAKTPFIADFIGCVKKTGVIFEAHICEAPFSVKKMGAKSQQHEFSFPNDILEAEHIAFRKNIPVIAAACNQNLTIWWRQDVESGLQPAAVATGNTYTTDLVAKTGFEAHFADIGGLNIDDLMGPYRRPTNEVKVERTLAPMALPA